MRSGKIHATVFLFILLNTCTFVIHAAENPWFVNLGYGLSEIDSPLEVQSLGFCLTASVLHQDLKMTTASHLPLGTGLGKIGACSSVISNLVILDPNQYSTLMEDCFFSNKAKLTSMGSTFHFLERSLSMTDGQFEEKLVCSPMHPNQVSFLRLYPCSKRLM